MLHHADPLELTTPRSNSPTKVGKRERETDRYTKHVRNKQIAKTLAWHAYCRKWMQKHAKHRWVSHPLSPNSPSDMVMLLCTVQKMAARAGTCSTCHIGPRLWSKQKCARGQWSKQKRARVAKMCARTPLSHIYLYHWVVQAGTGNGRSSLSNEVSTKQKKQLLSGKLT